MFLFDLWWIQRLPVTGYCFQVTGQIVFLFDLWWIEGLLFIQFEREGVFLMGQGQLNLGGNNSFEKNNLLLFLGQTENAGKK